MEQGLNRDMLLFNTIITSNSPSASTCTSFGAADHSGHEHQLSHSSVAAGHEWTADAESKINDLAADLSHGLFRQLLGNRSLQGLGFERLQVLTIAGSRISTDQLEEVMVLSSGLVKLDASLCQLQSVPSAAAFEGLKDLLVLFFHKNQLTGWEDIETALRAPALQWFTAFENPVASLPEFRDFVIEKKPQIRAVDHWVVTDGERLGLRRCHESRFAVQSQETIIPIRTHRTIQSAHVLLREAQSELSTLRCRRSHVSAACCIQTCFRAKIIRKKIRQLQDKRLRAIQTIQRRARAYLWRKQMVGYLKNYLAEINELDFLLSAKEMLRLRAAKRIESAVRQWIKRRSKQKNIRKAAEYVNRMTRGFIARRKVLQEHLEVKKYRRIYFPKEYAWEFLVMLNIVRKTNYLPPLPKTHQFRAAEFIGIRIPDTDEVPQRMSSLVAIVRFGQHCLLRPLRSNRFPEHAWDGPVHRIADASASPAIKRAYERIKRRGANVDNQCRKIFHKSCVPPGSHPLDLEVSGDSEDVSIVMKSILDGAESDWPYEAQIQGTPLNLFMTEAKRLGSRPRRPSKVVTIGAEKDTETGLPCYRRSAWLNQQVLYHECQSGKVVCDMLTYLLNLGKSKTRMPLVKPVPFLPEKTVIWIAAAVVIQSSYRAYKVRCNLSCGLRTALVIRRAAICIQRFWRWGLMKRRLELLIGAVKYVEAVKTASLYLEERLFTGLNLISSVDRYPPLLQERSLGLGCVSDESNNCTNVVLIRPDMRGLAKARGATSREALDAVTKRRDGGLPQWFMSRIGGDLQATGPDDKSLRRVCGLQAMLLEDVGERYEEHIETVTMASLKHAAKLAADANDHKAPALVACGGTFRFVEMRFQSVAQARQRALLIYLCTFNSGHHCVVPLVPKTMLHDSKVCKTILKLWDLYGFTWHAGDRAAPYQLKLRGAKMHTEVVTICGNQLMRIAMQGEWNSVDTKVTKSIGHSRRLEQTRESLLAMYTSFSAQYALKREQEWKNQQKQVRETSIERLYEDHAPGTVEVCVTGALPPVTSERVQEAPAAIMQAEKVAVKNLIADVKEREANRVRNLHDDVVNDRGCLKSTLGFEETIKAFQEEKHPYENQCERQLIEEQKLKEEEVKERVKTYTKELMHKKAENHIIRKSEVLSKVWESRESFDRDEFEQERFKRRDVKQEEHRAKREEARAEKAKRKESQNLINQFKSQKFWMETACGRYDADHRKEVELANAQNKILNRKRAWDHRKAGYAECLRVRQDFMKKQIEDMKDMLSNALKAASRDERRTLNKMRWNNQARRTFHGLIKMAKAEIEQYSREIDDGRRQSTDAVLEKSYMHTLVAFRNLANGFDHVCSSAADEDRDEEDTLTNQPTLTAWMAKGWFLDSDGSDSSGGKDSHVSLEDIPVEWKQKFNCLARASSLHLKTLLPKCSPDQVMLIPPKPAMDTPKTLPQLPRKPIGTLVRDAIDDHAKVGFAPAEEQQTLPKLPTPRPQLPSKAVEPESSILDNYESSGTTSAAEEEPVHRMLASSSKKRSEGALSTVTTGIGSSAADSATTLLSSQKSLPPIPMLAPPPVPMCPAMRGHSSRPKPLSASIMLPLEPAPLYRRRVPRAPRTAR